MSARSRRGDLKIATPAATRAKLAAKKRAKLVLLEPVGSEKLDPRSSAEMVDYAHRSKTLTELEAAILRCSASDTEIETAFERALDHNRAKVERELLGGENETVRVGKALRKIGELKDSERKELLLERLTTVQSRLKSDPAAASLEMLSLVKRFVGALQRNNLFLEAMKAPSVFIFRHGKVIISEYHAQPKKGEEPPPPAKVFEIPSLDSLPALLNSALPLLRSNEHPEGEKEKLPQKSESGLVAA